MLTGFGPAEKARALHERIILSKYALVAKGRDIHQKVFDKYPSIHPIYRGAILWGGASSTPYAIIYVPEADWKTLSKDEHDALGAYAKSFIGAIQAYPFAYTKIREWAPIAPVIRMRVASMKAYNWQIWIGPISADGVDIHQAYAALKGRGL